MSRRHVAVSGIASKTAFQLQDRKGFADSHFVCTGGAPLAPLGIMMHLVGAQPVAVVVSD